MPIGTILPYIGTLANIPSGWALCDGNNGTPNLAGRFLQGWGWDDFYWRNAGEYIQEGLPNIYGRFGFESQIGGSSGGPIFTGPFGYEAVYYRGHLATGIEGYNQDAIFDASKCSLLYGNSATVQPRSYVVYYIMKIKN